MSKLERSVTCADLGKACPQCIELTTQLVAVQHELYESQKREEILRHALGLIAEGMEVELGA